MHFVLHYRLAAEHLDLDRRLLHEVYSDLATRQPSWLACETFQLDDHLSMVFLLATPDIERIEELPTLASYLRDLADRCEGEPKAGVMDRAGLDTTSAAEIGLWDPDRVRWTLPALSRLTV